MRWAYLPICHHGRVFSCLNSSRCLFACFLSLSLSVSFSHSVSTRLSRFESWCAGAKWKVTPGRQRHIKHSGSLSKKHAGSRWPDRAGPRCRRHFELFYRAVVQALAKSQFTSRPGVVASRGGRVGRRKSFRATKI